MHKYLKVFILIILLWTITLPWTLSYLSTLTAMPGNEIGRIGFGAQLKSSTFKFNDEKIIIGAVACGEKALNETIVLLKSVILSCIYHGVKSLDAILFADDDHLYTIDLQVRRVKLQTRGLNFRYEIHPVVFPAKSHDEWESLFKPCASQRLFLHTALPHIDKILYLDVDTLVVGNIKEVWEKFERMSSHQAVGIVAEHEASSIGWYNRFALHPFYPPLGLNTGVMLMNLTKLRNDLQWEDSILSAYKAYKDKIVFGDQDLINIVFYDHPDAVYLLPCSYNYRPDHCQYGWNCGSAESGRGIHILHGNRNVFHNETLCPIFHKVYSYYAKFDMTKDDYRNDLILPLQRELEKTKPLSMNTTINCDHIGPMFFKY